MDWRFDEFVHGSQDRPRGIVSGDLEAAPRAELDVILSEHLGIKPYHEWTLPHYQRIGDGLGEIRFKVNNIQYRVYGSCGGEKVFRMWLVATKSRIRKGKQKTDPPNAIDKARTRKRAYELHKIGGLKEYV